MSGEGSEGGEGGGGGVGEDSSLSGRCLPRERAVICGEVVCAK